MKTPFHMLIVGMTACGKTHYLLKMLEENFKGHFDYVFFVCPTFLENKTYLEWKFLGITTCLQFLAITTTWTIICKTS